MTKTATEMPGHSEPCGDRVFFTWAEKAAVMIKMDDSSKNNIHGKLMRWEERATIKVERGECKLCGLYLDNVKTNK